jgi:pimeloyl-ACP methyl ester carboxylesterase
MTTCEALIASSEGRPSDATARLIAVDGRGPVRQRPLLFVHGIYHGAWCFLEHFVPYFAARGHACYALTLRGHDGRGRIRHSRADYLADMRLALESIRPAPLLVGHSLGGMLAQELVAEGTVEDAVLLATPTPGALLRRAFIETFRHPEVLAGAWAHLDMQRAYHSEVLVREGFFAKDLPYPALRRHLARLRAVSYGTWSLLRTLLAPISRPDARARRRVLVVGGADDPTCTPAVQAKIARIYGTTPTIVAGVSHDLMLDTKWRDAADAIASWMAGHARA